MPVQQAVRPAETTGTCLVPSHNVALAPGPPVAPLWVSSPEMAPRPVPASITVWPDCAGCAGEMSDVVPSPPTLNASAGPKPPGVLVKIPKADVTTVMGAVEVVPELFTVTVPVPTGVAEGRIASTSLAET